MLECSSKHQIRGCMFLCCGEDEDELKTHGTASRQGRKLC
jgi:hypothetical protein